MRTHLTPLFLTILAGLAPAAQAQRGAPTPGLVEPNPGKAIAHIKARMHELQ